MRDSEEQTERLDRLVDGELSPEERRSLLRSLDAAPDGWRRCALAFLEAQSLRAELAALATPAEPAPVSPAPTVKQPNRRSRPAVWFTVAASALVAFGLGTLANRGLFPPAPGGRLPDPGVAAIDAPGGPNAAEQVAGGPSRPLDGAGESLTFWVTDDRGERRSFSAPLVDAEQFDSEHGMRFPSSVSPLVRRQLEGRGYRLTTRRRYAPLYLEDGQPLVVPVEDVQIVPVVSAAL